MRRGSALMLIEILLAAGIVLFLAQYLLKQYSRTTAGTGGQGDIGTQPTAAIDAARSAVDQANALQQQRLKETEQAY